MSPLRSPLNRSQTLQALVFGALILAVTLTQGAFFANVLRWPDTADKGWISTGQLGYNVVLITRPAGEAAGLRVGDVIVRLNGSSYDGFDELVRLLDLQLGHVNRYEIERGDRTVTIEVPNQPLGWERVLRQSGVFFGVGMVFVALGILVFLMKPFRGPSWAFFGTCQLLGMMITYWAPSNFYYPPYLNEVLIWVVPLVPAAILNLTALFPERRSTFADRKLLLVLPWLVSLAFAAWARSFGPSMYVTPRDLQLGIFGFAFGSILIFLASTALAFTHGSSFVIRLRALLVFSGILIALLIPLVEQLANLVFRVSLLPDPILFYAVSLTAFPLAIGYSIVRHDLFEISAVVRRTYGYLLSTVALVGAYALMLAGLNLTLGANISESPILSTAFIVALVFLIEPLRRRSQGLVDGIFHRQRYDYRKALRRVSDAITSVLDPDEIHRVILNSLVNEMRLENGVLLLPDTAQATLRPQLIVGDERNRIHHSTAVPMALLSGERRALRLGDVELATQLESRYDELRRSFTSLRSALFLPITLKDQVQGVLSLGPKKSGRVFTLEDLDLLHTVAGQSAIALENARLFEDLSAKTRRIEILESMKANLSKFVPQAVRRLVEEAPLHLDVFAKHREDLTVLFADMTGYTRLSSVLPLEEVNALLERYFGAFLDEILKRDGDVNETAGDGLMVLFRSPDPDAHARSAVAAGLAIQRRCAELNEGRGPESQPVTMHVGVNSGTCAVGATRIEGISGARWTFTASGLTTNIAARLGALPEASQGVVISGETRNRLGDAFRLSELGPQALKNVSAPVHAFLAEGEATVSLGSID